MSIQDEINSLRDWATASAIQAKAAATADAMMAVAIAHLGPTGGVMLAHAAATLLARVIVYGALEGQEAAAIEGVHAMLAVQIELAKAMKEAT